MSATLDETSVRLATWLAETAPVDPHAWPTFAADAGMRGVAGLILENKAACDALRPEIVNELQRWSTRAAFENIHALRQVAPRIATLERAGIRVMLLKGAALLATVYDRPELRPMSDVDLLVHPADARRAVDLLVEAGCRRGAALVRDDFFPRFHYEVELFIPDPHPVRIDLHARPFRPMRLSRIIPDDAMWEDARSVQAMGAMAYVPRPELFLIHLAAHAAFHGCNRLTWLYDMARFVRCHGSNLDWELLLARCERWRLGLAVGAAFRAAESLLGSFVPEQVLVALGRQRCHWRDRMILRQAPRDAQSPLRHVLCNVLSTPGSAFNAAYLWNMLAPGATHFGANPSSAAQLHRARLSRVGRAIARLATGLARATTRRQRRLA